MLCTLFIKRFLAINECFSAQPIPTVPLIAQCVHPFFHWDSAVGFYCISADLIAVSVFFLLQYAFTEYVTALS